MCEIWHRHRIADLLACGIAGMRWDEFQKFTEAHCPDNEQPPADVDLRD